MNSLRNYVLLTLVILLVSAGSLGNAAPMTPAEDAIAQQINDMFVVASSKANPSVVTIASDRVVQRRFRGPSFDFWNFNFEPFNRAPEFRSTVLGSGVIINAAQGYIVTNNHVVQDAEEITVILMDRREVPAAVIGTDLGSDVAVIKIETDNLQQAQVGNSDELRIGEWVLAIGSPFSQNLDHTVTAGIVSAKGRSDIIRRNQYQDFIQTDAAINPGNSGGALVNLKGELIGINTAIATDGSVRANVGVGFAIPINMVMQVVDDLIEDGKVTRAYLGVNLNDLDVDATMAKALGMKSPEGALVNRVQDDTPAEKAGLKEGDVIIRVDDIAIRDNSHLMNVISSSRPGEQRSITVLRDGRERTVSVKLDELPEQAALATRDNYRSEESAVSSPTGFTVADLDSRVAQRIAQRVEIQVDEGVMITGVDPHSKAAKVGIQTGDIVVKVGDQTVRNVRDYNRALDKYKKGEAVLLRILRIVRGEEVSFFIGVELS